MILIKLRTKSAVLRAEQSARYSRTLGRISNAEATTKLERINGREIRGKKYIYIIWNEYTSSRGNKKCNRVICNIFIFFYIYTFLCIYWFREKKRAAVAASATSKWTGVIHKWKKLVSFINFFLVGCQHLGWNEMKWFVIVAAFIDVSKYTT